MTDYPPLQIPIELVPEVRRLIDKHIAQKAMQCGQDQPKDPLSSAVSVSIVRIEAMVKEIHAATCGKPAS